MSTPSEHPEPTPLLPMASPRRPHPALRALAGVAGLLCFALGAIVTLGTALAAPIGIGAVGWLERRRGRPLTRGVSWLGAFGGSTLIIAVLLAVALIHTWGEFAKQMQSAPKTPPPEWLQRISPPNPAAENMFRSRPFAIAIGVLTVSFASAFLGSLSGTVGWGSTLLVGYAIRGRWPWRTGHPEE